MISDNIRIDNKPNNIEDFFNKFKDYADTRIDLFKLKAISKVSGFTSTIVTMVILLMIMFVAIICISIGAALLIGHFLGEAYYGFFIIAGLYLIIGVVLYSKRGTILKSPVSDKLIKEMVG